MALGNICIGNRSGKKIVSDIVMSLPNTVFMRNERPSPNRNRHTSLFVKKGHTDLLF